MNIVIRHAVNGKRDGVVASTFFAAKAMLLFLAGIGIVTSVQAAAPDEFDIDATYFHPAASMYIHGDSSGASNLVARGLASFPDDGKLLRLKDLLEKQQQQEQEQQNQNQQDQDQDQEQNQDQNQQQEQEQQNPDQKQQPEDRQEQDPQSEQNQQQQPEPPRAEEMTEDEARQLLDAMRQEEENKRLQLHPVMGAPVKVDKDW